MFILPPELIAAMNERVVEPVYFVYVDWVGGEVFVHTHIGDIIFKGKTWLGVGRYGEIGNVTDDGNLGSHSLKLTLSGIDPLSLSEVTTKGCIGRTVTVYAGFLNEQGQLIGATQYFDGRIAEATIQRFDSDSIALSAVSKTSDWAKSRSDRYTHGSHIAKHPGDYFFQYVDDMATRDINGGNDKGNIPLRPRSET